MKRSRPSSPTSPSGPGRHRTGSFRRAPAFGVYRGEGAAARPFGINVVEIESGLVTGMHFFLFPELFPAFGLPDTLK